MHGCTFFKETCRLSGQRFASYDDAVLSIEPHRTGVEVERAYKEHLTIQDECLGMQSCPGRASQLRRGLSFLSALEPVLARTGPLPA